MIQYVEELKTRLTKTDNQGYCECCAGGEWSHVCDLVDSGVFR